MLDVTKKENNELSSLVQSQAERIQDLESKNDDQTKELAKTRQKHVDEGKLSKWVQQVEIDSMKER